MPGGGDVPERDVMRYQPPTGPKNMYRAGPGLRGGENAGMRGTQENAGSAGTSGTVGQLTTRNYGNCGSQGRRE